MTELAWRSDFGILTVLGSKFRRGANNAISNQKTVLSGRRATAWEKQNNVVQKIFSLQCDTAKTPPLTSVPILRVLGSLAEVLSALSLDTNEKTVYSWCRISSWLLRQVCTVQREASAPHMPKAWLEMQYIDKWNAILQLDKWKSHCWRE